MIWLRDPRSAGRARLRGQLAGARAGWPASSSCCRSGSTSTRPRAGSRWSRSGAVRALHGRHRAAVRHLRRAARRRLRRPRAGRAPTRAHAGVGRRGDRSSPARCWPPPTWPASPCSPRCSPSRSAPRSRRALAAPERFLWLLVSGGLACVIAPELVYVRDAFDGSDLFRMNTVFKLGYQAWLLLALAAACALPWAGAHLPRRAWPVWAAGAAVLLLLGLVYPYAGTYARKGGFARSPSLDGLAWLQPDRPGRSARDRLAARQHARQRGRARGGGGRLLGLRPRPHLDLQRPPDRARLGRPRAAVGPRAGRPRRGRPHALHDRRPRRRRAS